jgi:hypothetical protein
MNSSLATMLALLSAMFLVGTFCLTWWIRGRGFAELLDLFRGPRKPPGPRAGDNHP